jgi:multiple sugar transport system substrate-binding protein
MVGMKKTKQVITMCLLFAMLTTFMVGCKSSDNTSSTSSAPVTLTFIHWGTSQAPAMKAVAAGFHKKYPNITIDVESTPWAEYFTKLDAAANGGSMPDIMWMHPNNFIRYAKAGMLLDVTNKVTKDARFKWSNFPDSLVKLYKYSGKSYAVPKDYDTAALWYNKTLFDQKGIAYPDGTWDWNKLSTVAKQLTDPSKGIYGFVSPNDAQQDYDAFIYQNGGYPINADKTKSGWDSSETIAAMKFALSFSLVDKTSPTQAQFANTDPETYFESGKAAMGIFNSSYVVDYISNDYTKKNCDVTEIPHGIKKATIINGLGYAISAKTKHPAEAVEYLEYLSSKEGSDIISNNGGAIPANTSADENWFQSRSTFKGIKIFQNMISNSVLWPTNWEGYSAYSQDETDITTKMYAGQISVEDGCKQLAQKMNAAIASIK